MAQTLKRLGANSPSATTNTSLYQVPSSTSAVIAELSICNQNTTDVTVRVAHVDGAIANVATEDYVFYDIRVSAKSTLDGLLKGKALAASDSIMVYASATGVSFVLTGMEITV